MSSSSSPNWLARASDVLDRLAPAADPAPGAHDRLRRLVEAACVDQGLVVSPAELDQALTGHWQAWPAAPIAPSSPSAAPSAPAWGWARPKSMEELEHHRRGRILARFRCHARARLGRAFARSQQPVVFDLWFLAGWTVGPSLLFTRWLSMGAAGLLTSMMLAWGFVALVYTRPRLDLWWWRLWAWGIDPWEAVQPSDPQLRRWAAAPASRAYLEACVTGAIPLLAVDAEHLDRLSRHVPAAEAWAAQQARIQHHLAHSASRPPEIGRTIAG